jgi:hypothetical protein
MSSIFDALSTHLDDHTLGQLSSSLGTDRGATSKAIAAAIPLLLGALAKNAGTPEGAQAIHDAVTRDHDGSILDNPNAATSPAATADGDAILGHVLGDRRSMAEQGISRASGLDMSKVGPLLAMLAPLVMGALGRAQRSGNLGAGGLASVLGMERDALGASAPGVLGVISRLLDRDHDGSVLDDVGGMLGGLLGRR